MKKKGLVMLISGTGGAGKNTLIQGMLGKNGFKFISSYTTRERRDVDSPNQYQYITTEVFESKIKSGEIFEYDIFNDNYYGTSKKLFFDGLDEAQVVLKDISVMGFDNNPIAEYFNPALTTVAQPQKEIGLQAMQLLLRKIHDPASPPVEIRLPHRLIIRESVRLLDKETV